MMGIHLVTTYQVRLVKSLLCVQTQEFTIIIIIIIIAPLSIVSEDEWGDLECQYKSAEQL